MNPEKDFIHINRNTWNEKTEFHLKSEFYNVNEFLRGKSSLNDLELKILGNISGKKILHLQCHFGQDTISLSRMGAQVTGVDFSDKAIAAAKEMTLQTHTSAQFICCNVYDLDHHLNEQFDIVFTSYGTIGWLPDLDKWAHVISTFLKPEGRFVFVEFHPVVWMFDDEFEKVGYNYFNDGPIIETESGTYADRDAPIKNKSVNWNHSLSEVINNLIKNNLYIQSMDEFDYSPYNCFNHTIESEKGKFRIKHLENRIPMVYAIEAIKRT